MLANGATVDWRLVESESAVPAVRRGTDERDIATRVAASGWKAVVVVGLLQVALVAVEAPIALSRPAAPMPSWLFLVNVLLFGISGALLLFGGRHDRRLQSLGAVFVMIASAFAHPLMRRVDSSGWMHLGLVSLSIDAFFAAALWLFVWSFPRAPEHGAVRRVGQVLTAASCAAGVILVSVNLLDASRSADETSLMVSLVRALSRDTPNSFYWLVSFGLASLALPYLAWKSRRETPADRRRVNFVFYALVVGMAPFLFAVLASIVTPALGRQPWRDLVGIALYSALASTIPSMAYAVLVERAMAIEFAVARARQWQIARSCASFFGLIPLSYLSIDLYLHRDVSLATYLDGGRGFSLFLLLFIGFTALTFRYQLLFGVDRWFRADRPGQAESLARLESILKGTQTIRDATEGLAVAIERAIGPTAVVVLVVDENGTLLIPLSGSAPSLPTDSTLVDLVHSAVPNMPIRFAADGPLFTLLPESDQAWVSALRVEVMVPLLGSTGALFGVAVLGEAKHGLPYSAHDHALVRSMCAQVGLRVENQWLRDRPSQERSEGPAARHSGVHWQHEPAELCLNCSRVLPPTTKRCGCGSAVATAALPLVTAGKFRLERQLGSGGMGVVYLATDLVLGRRVALKTLPRVSDSLAERLEREARAMATVLHPNLALIYGAEKWRGNPVLIVEYLEGGTVLDGLRRGPFTVNETLGLGILIADVLDRLHGAGILHRDVKPSNIGYTLSGVPKLLDLGLAAAFAPQGGDSRPPTRRAVVSSLQDEYAVTSDSRQLGTLRYMAPEALDGQSPRPSFDLWALSLVLYEVLAGRHPLADLTGHGLLKGLQRAAIPDIRDVRPDCPPAIAEFLQDALAADPARRPRTAADLRAVLQSVLTPS